MDGKGFQEENLMDKLGIIQPGKIGDIIICLPIARYYQKLGYEIIWPIGKDYVGMFQSAVDYVTFIPVSNNIKTWVNEAKLITRNCNKEMDLAFGFRGRDLFTYEWKKSGLHFDEYKYVLASVPFEEKWNLEIKRNPVSEQKLFDNVISEKPYIVCQRFSSDIFIQDLQCEEDEHKYGWIEIKPYTNNVFDWLKILEEAEKLVLIDSCYVNLVDQLGIKTKKRRIRKPPPYTGEENYPVLRGNWEKK